MLVSNVTAGILIGKGGGTLKEFFLGSAAGKDQRTLASGAESKVNP